LENFQDWESDSSFMQRFGDETSESLWRILLPRVISTSLEICNILFVVCVLDGQSLNLLIPLEHPVHFCWTSGAHFTCWSQAHLRKKRLRWVLMAICVDAAEIILKVWLSQSRTQMWLPWCFSLWKETQKKETARVLSICGPMHAILSPQKWYLPEILWRQTWGHCKIPHHFWPINIFPSLKQWSLRGVRHVMTSSALSQVYRSAWVNSEYRRGYNVDSTPQQFHNFSWICNTNFQKILLHVHVCGMN